MRGHRSRLDRASVGSGRMSWRAPRKGATSRSGLTGRKRGRSPRCSLDRARSLTARRNCGDARLSQCAVARLRSGARRGRATLRRGGGEAGIGFDIEFADGHVEAHADGTARKPSSKRSSTRRGDDKQGSFAEADGDALSPRSCWKRREQAGVTRRLEVMVTDILKRRATRS